MNAKLITQEQMNKLLANGRDRPNDPEPVVKLFTPDGSATWLLSEVDEDGDTAFGLCDLGFGCPELGYVSLSEIASVRGGLGLPIERDRWFKADRSIGKYAALARAEGRIVA